MSIMLVTYGFALLSMPLTVVIVAFASHFLYFNHDPSLPGGGYKNLLSQIFIIEHEDLERDSEAPTSWNELIDLSKYNKTKF